MGLRAPGLTGFSPPDANDAAVPIALRFWYAVDFPDNLFDATPAFSQLTDRGSLGGDAAQGTAAARPVRASVNGRLAAQYDNTDDVLDSNIGAINYRFCNDGTGATIFAVGRRTLNDGAAHEFFDTVRAADTRTGFSLQQLATTNSARFRVGNSSGTWVIDDSAAGFPEDGLAHVVVARWSTAFGYDVRVDGVSGASGAIVGVPDAGNPHGSLALGARTVAPAAFWRGDWLEGGAYAGLLTDAVVEQLETYLGRWYG